MYQVFDNNKTADCFGCNVHESWNNSRFETFEEAVDYANNWLDIFGGGAVLKLNVPYDYSGYGDLIEIRLVD